MHEFIHSGFGEPTIYKPAFAIILGPEYCSYWKACQSLQMETLSVRRQTLSLKFANKSSKHPIHSHWFEENHLISRTRSKKPNFKPVIARTSRLKNSAIPYMTDLLDSIIWSQHQLLLVDDGYRHLRPNQWLSLSHYIVLSCTVPYHLH